MLFHWESPFRMAHNGVSGTTWMTTSLVSKTVEDGKQ